MENIPFMKRVGAPLTDEQAAFMQQMDALSAFAKSLFPILEEKAYAKFVSRLNAAEIKIWRKSTPYFDEVFMEVLKESEAGAFAWGISARVYTSLRPSRLPSLEVSYQNTKTIDIDMEPCDLNYFLQVTDKAMKQIETLIQTKFGAPQ